jgi:D-serine deaminase-like pyridoxal phosphate-dependent protein
MISHKTWGWTLRKSAPDEARFGSSSSRSRSHLLRLNSARGSYSMQRHGERVSNSALPNVGTRTDVVPYQRCTIGDLDNAVHAALRS